MICTNVKTLTVGRWVSTNRFQLFITGRFGTCARVQSNSTEEIVGTETDSQGKNKVGERMILGFLHKSGNPAEQNPYHGSAYDASKVGCLIHAVRVGGFV